ncbi:hypothetical protein [Elioraea rosea]|uniref:hypothetical protein n=1 Tax=Elioraea rosea TaxID=2492390 RepID=UPI001185B86A|nr:hypothetical protein [Elioraea rosea]
MQTGQPRPPNTRAPSPWWPRREPWRIQPGESVPATREAQLPPAPPPSPPMLNRVAGALLLAATLGLASCQSFLAVVT